ncbi:hypothetical protein HF521_011833 [Silurus meridionalis]|uniref:Uncharacterized protein n=1 Tax=Silurus meridionalis TaxID=175797 RepID=A0A8T0AF22_SILME|nr:hypothetical protein HF521_011833 [Silurus meridionalis]
MIGRADIEGSKSDVAMSGSATSQLSLWCTAPVKLPTCHCPRSGSPPPVAPGSPGHRGGLGSQKREPTGARLPASPAGCWRGRRARGPPATRPPPRPPPKGREAGEEENEVSADHSGRSRRASAVQVAAAAPLDRRAPGPPSGATRRGGPRSAPSHAAHSPERTGEGGGDAEAPPPPGRRGKGGERRREGHAARDTFRREAARRGGGTAAPPAAARAQPHFAPRPDRPSP